MSETPGDKRFMVISIAVLIVLITTLVLYSASKAF